MLGYDAFNEPSCEIQRAPCGLPPAPAAGAQWLKPFYDELVPAIRAADPRHPVFYEDYLTTAFGYPYTLGDAVRSGQGLSYHVYCPHPLRAERSCEELEREAVERSVAYARERRVAPLLTEFGATDDLAVVGRIAALADAKGQSWHYWQYKTYFDPTTSARTSPGASADAESIVDEGGTVKAGQAEGARPRVPGAARRPRRALVVRSRRAAPSTCATAPAAAAARRSRCRSPCTTGAATAPCAAAASCPAAARRGWWSATAGRVRVQVSAR